MRKLPKKIKLPAIKQQWKISYIESSGRLILIEHPRKELALYGKHYTKLAALTLISSWIALKARVYLTDMIKQLNRRVKAKYKKIVIRSQVSQWGSFTPNKKITLDYKLIFLPTRLIKNVIYHELCHVKYASHSKSFWQELEKYDKQCKKNDSDLNDANKYIPKWVI